VSAWGRFPGVHRLFREPVLRHRCPFYTPTDRSFIKTGRGKASPDEADQPTAAAERWCKQAATPVAAMENPLRSDLDPNRDNQTPVSRRTGWDYVATEPGAAHEMRCRVCGAKMVERRGVVGPTGWAHALAMHGGRMPGRRQDVFICCFSPRRWHRQALELRQEALRTPSQRLQEALAEEADQIVRTRTPTREG
jgi:hypothetical protein